MPKHFKSAKPCVTDLTWEEKNPSSYLFNVEVLTKLQQAIEKFKNGEVSLYEGRENRPSGKND